MCLMSSLFVVILITQVLCVDCAAVAPQWTILCVMSVEVLPQDSERCL